MEKIDEKLNNLSSVEFPEEVHDIIMHKVYYEKKKPIFLIAFALLVTSFIAILWNINNKLAEAEFLDMMSDFFSSFYLSFSFVSTILESFFEIISPMILFSLLINVIGMIYIAKRININFYKTTLKQF